MNNHDALKDFPYKKLIMDPDDIANKISDIKNNIPKYSTEPYRPTAIHQKLNLIDGKYYGKYIKIITTADLYEKVNVLTDYFNEQSRMKCSFNYYMEPINYFRVYKKKIMYDLKKNKKEINPHNVREYIYSHIKECNLFKVSTAVFVYDFFKAKHILDFSSGWGDRLLAACALGITYFGIDPNINNHEGYNNIIKIAGNGTQKVYRSGAEYLPNDIISSRIKKYGKFDLIFTSPPYFDYEVYSGSLQSISSYTASAEYWLVYFLFVVIVKYIPFLETNGTLGIYIQDIKNKFIVCEPIVLFILSFFPNMEFSGIISENFPMLLFKKKSDEITGTEKNMEHNFIKTYPKIYQLSHRLIKRNLFNCYDIETTYSKYNLNNTDVHIINDNVENNVYFRTFFKLLVQDESHTNVVTYGSRMTTMVYFLAKAAYILNKTCEFYCPKIEKDVSKTDGDMNFLPLSFYPKILDAKKNYGLKVIEVDVEMTKKQITYIKNMIEPKLNDILINFTDYDQHIKNITRETIFETITILGIDTNFTGTIFLTVSVTLAVECLYDIFRSAKFYIVQTNHWDYTKSYEMGRTTLVYSEYLFSQNVPDNKMPPPEINCIPHISCKIWELFKTHAIEGDILWMNAI